MLYLDRVLGAHRSGFSPEEIEVMRQAATACASSCAEVNLPPCSDRKLPGGRIGAFALQRPEQLLY